MPITTSHYQLLLHLLPTSHFQLIVPLSPARHYQPLPVTTTPATNKPLSSASSASKTIHLSPASHFKPLLPPPKPYTCYEQGMANYIFREIPGIFRIFTNFLSELVISRISWCYQEFCEIPGYTVWLQYGESNLISFMQMCINMMPKRMTCV